MKNYFYSLALLMLCALTIIPSCKKEPLLKSEQPIDAGLLQQAKDWHQQQLSLPSSTTPGAIDLKAYTPDWSKAKVVKNSKGQDVIGAPLFRSRQTCIDLNVLAVNGKIIGIIKKGIPDQGKLDIYTDGGKLIESRNYKTKKFSNSSGIRIMAIDTPDLGCSQVEHPFNGGRPIQHPEVVITAPGMGSNDSSYSFPSGFIGGNDPFFSQGNDYYGSGGGGSNGGGDGSARRDSGYVPTPEQAPAVPLHPEFRLDPWIRVSNPKFAKLIDNLPSYLSKLENIKVMDALIKFSGFTKEKILELAQPGKGPLISVISNHPNFSIADGFFNPSEGIHKFYIDKFYADKLETQTIGLAQREQATAFFLTAVTLHEFVHWSRYINGMPGSYFDGNQYNEAGTAFENDAFGMNINYTTSGSYLYKFTIK